MLLVAGPMLVAGLIVLVLLSRTTAGADRHPVVGNERSGGAADDGSLTFDDSPDEDVITRLLAWSAEAAGITIHPNATVAADATQPSDDQPATTDPTESKTPPRTVVTGWSLLAAVDADLGATATTTPSVVIPKGSVIVSVPASATISSADVPALETELDERFRQRSFPEVDKMQPYLDVLQRTRYRVPLSLPEPIAERCLGAHFLRLYRDAQRDLEGRHRGASQSAFGIRKEVLAVRTRALHFAPGEATHRDGHNEVMLPVIDFANHAARSRNAKVVYDAPSERFLLVAVRDILEGEGIFISYGNIRTPVDAVDTYGFFNASDALRIAAQVKIPEVATDAMMKASCTKESQGYFTFDVVTGKPSNALMICASLWMLKQPSEQDAFVQGTLPVTVQLGLKVRVMKKLAKLARDELAPMYGRPAAKHPSHPPPPKQPRKQPQGHHRRLRCIQNGLEHATLATRIAFDGSPKVLDATETILRIVFDAEDFMQRALLRAASYCQSEAERLMTRYRDEVAKQSAESPPPPSGGDDAGANDGAAIGTQTRADDL